MHTYASPGAGSTNGISIEFEIRSKFGALWFKIFSADHNVILQTPQQLHSRDNQEYHNISFNF